MQSSIASFKIERNLDHCLDHTPIKKVFLGPVICMIRCAGYSTLGVHRDLIHWDLSVAKQGLTEKNPNIKEKKPRVSRTEVHAMMGKGEIQLSAVSQCGCSDGGKTQRVKFLESVENVYLISEKL